MANVDFLFAALFFWIAMYQDFLQYSRIHDAQYLPLIHL